VSPPSADDGTKQRVEGVTKNVKPVEDDGIVEGGHGTNEPANNKGTGDASLNEAPANVKALDDIVVGLVAFRVNCCGCFEPENKQTNKFWNHTTKGDNPQEGLTNLRQSACQGSK